MPYVVNERWLREEQGHEANGGTNRATNRRHKVPNVASHVVAPLVSAASLICGHNGSTEPLSQPGRPSEASIAIVLIPFPMH
jgi:hypothetical protein